MARERIKVTRPDATGFDEVVKPVRDRSDFTTLKVDSIDAFEKKRRQSEQVQKPVSTSDAPVESMTTGEESGKLQEPVSESAGDPRPATSLARKKSISKNEKRDRPSNSAMPRVEKNELVELSLPPRRRPDGYINLSLRLRVLGRHAEALKVLEDNGVDVRDVFRTAYRSIPPINFIPRYVPQVAEPSGPGKYSYRIGPPVLQATIKAIEAQVRGGANASRASLLLGQIEPVWFEKLDLTIKEYTK
ncbi:hypothetical protein [Paracoccus sp. 228]|uniref:hypothetical protein n=1 Tax=Paracoccus sp. 228 TaxID=1192054 RepID=UPI000B0096A7|nr:hypothetical protein [Paracoccus sp. 228]